jgi:hypothetical protein
VLHYNAGTRTRVTGAWIEERGHTDTWGSSVPSVLAVSPEGVRRLQGPGSKQRVDPGGALAVQHIAADDAAAQALALNVLARRAGPGGYCSPRHPTHCEPSSRERDTLPRV